MTSGLMTSNVDEYMQFDISQKVFEIIIISIASCFVIYPPVIYISRKKGLNLIKIIRLKDYQ